MLVQRLFYGSLLIAGLVLIFWGDYIFASAPIDPNERSPSTLGRLSPVKLAEFGQLDGSETLCGRASPKLLACELL